MPRLSKIGAAALAAFGWTGLASVTASYLVVAGGAGGGGYFGGGGGAGGYQSGTTSLNPTLSYTVTVGGGGAGGDASGTVGVNGSNSQFGTLTASVGGGGGGASFIGSSGIATGQNGGSGGGAGLLNPGTPSGGTATSGQGSAGGSSTTYGGTANYGCAGGGGAGGAGSNGNGSSSTGGNGGSSSTWAVNSVAYAGGGGGAGSVTPGSGGTGGGTGGTNSGTPAGPTAGTANLGGGGGGAGQGPGARVGGQGGSGVVIISYPAPQQFGGGVVTTSGSNVIHTFNTSGTLSPLSSLTASYLIVAGGGSGGDGYAGGGGAGGLLSGTGLTIDTNSNYLVTVGAGGTASTGGNNRGNQGTNSTFSMVTTAAVGGGGGAGFVSGQTAQSGGSGGGGMYSQLGGYGNPTGGSATSGQGYAGGTPAGTGGYFGGGGGGAGGAGATGSGSSTGTSTGGNGGVGIANPITGSTAGQNVGGTYYLAGGGGGGAYYTGVSAGSGGNGGGGAGSKTSGVIGTAGTANTGGGGGGSCDGAASSAIGGSGVVIISYAGSTQQMAGGTVTISGGNVIHTFTSSGYLTPIKLVNNSLRFRSSASAYLNRTPATASNRRTWTWNGWVKRGILTSGYQVLFMGGATQSDTGATAIIFNANDTFCVQGYNTNWLVTTQVFRDPAAWYMITVVMDSTNATANNRLRVYVNGVEVTSFSTRNNLTQNTDYGINQAALHTIAYQSVAFGNTYFDGYQTEVNFIDGQALTPSSFGTFNSYGVWQPITYGGSYGTNGFYLPFTNATSATTLAYDFSPNGNNWTTNNISLTAGSTYDSMTDVPTLTSATAANYCVVNPLDKGGGVTITDGNLTLTRASSVLDWDTARCTIQVPSTGQYYWELTLVSGSNDGCLVGVGTATADLSQEVNGFWAYQSAGYIIYNGSYTTATALSVGDVVMVAFDRTNNKLWFGRNGTWGLNGGTPVTPTDPNSNFTSLPSNLFPAVGIRYTANSAINFGQQPFVYTPPANFVALNTYNL